jgi:hypothetical protein
VIAAPGHRRQRRRRQLVAVVRTRLGQQPVQPLLIAVGSCAQIAARRRGRLDRLEHLSDVREDATDNRSASGNVDDVFADASTRRDDRVEGRIGNASCLAFRAQRRRRLTRRVGVCRGVLQQGQEVLQLVVSG